VPELYAYNTSNFNLTRKISITGSSNIWAIVASPRYNCLYISDNDKKVVYRFNLSNNVITQWSVGGTCHGLSLTSTHNVLISLRDPKQIQEYTQDGGFIREINLDSSIVNLVDSVQMSSDRFVVSHKDGGTLHRVCLVDTCGRIIQCYGGAIGSGVGQLNGPGYLAVDGHGNVLIADEYNNRVVLLNSLLTLLGYIKISERLLSRPHALHLDELTHRIYIGEWTNIG